MTFRKGFIEFPQKLPFGNIVRRSLSVKRFYEMSSFVEDGMVRRSLLDLPEHLIKEMFCGSGVYKN